MYVCDALPTDLLLPDKVVLLGLLHDASEAYLGDMVRPVKRKMPEYQAAEDRLMNVILGKFGITDITDTQLRMVEDADDKILYREMALFFPDHPEINYHGEKPLKRRGQNGNGYDAFMDKFLAISGSMMP
jgi:hypothetical protein